MNRKKKHCLIGYLIALSQVFCMHYTFSQCTYDIVTPIPDNNSTSINLIVSGLTDSDLSSPTQGICGVEIEFVHEYLGDLTITLISPSGTQVDLIGPPTTTTLPTNLSSWNISFIPCLTPASPDLGFTPVWSNLQAWQALTAYTGSYHPQNGCLEDFDTGSANGVWQLLIEDHDEFQIGSIANITLLFCNSAGIECLPCMPNGGTLSPALIEICSGENVQSGDLMIDFGGPAPSPLIYNYEYLFLSGNTILQSGTNFSLTPPVGNYTICGLNYLINDTMAIHALISMGDYSQLSQAINQGDVCADLSNSCVTLNVSGKPDTLNVSGDLCGGEVFSYNGQNYFTDGVFYQTIDGPGLCDTTVEIRIHPRTLSVVVDPPDTLFCGSGDVQLIATPSGGPGPFTFQWTTTNGNITSPANTASITVNQSGQYFVEVSDGVCVGSGSTNVVAGPNFPQVIFSGGTITCANPTVNIKPIYSPASASVLWNGPMGFTSTMPNIGVTIPGNYTLNITNAAGCTTRKTVNIGLDTATVPVDIIVLNKDCQNQTLTLADAQPHLLNSWQWDGPGGFSSNFWRPIVSLPGLYTFTGTFVNGCIRHDTYLFDEDFTIPDISVSPRDTLNCNEFIDLTVSSATPGVTYNWIGPAGFFSDQSSIQIDQAGLYIATVFGPLGCEISDTVIIDQGDDVFDYQVVTDTLTCAKTMVTIGVVSPDADQFEWLNYNGPDADQPMIKVTAGGNYIVRMTSSTSGCQVTVSVIVRVDYQVPGFDFTRDTINCFNPVSNLSFVPQAGFTYSSIFWELPDLTIVQSPTIMSSLPGVHRLTAISPNGCQLTKDVVIPFDTLTPFLLLDTDTLICYDTVTVVAQSLDDVSSFQWDGPGIVDFVGLSINVNQPGWYHLTASGPNGCPSEYDILVDSNYAIPVYTVLADSLRCDMSAVLSVIPSGLNYAYSWSDPMASLISTDSFAVVDEPGVYTVQIEGQNQCIAFDTIRLDSLLYPTVALAADTFTCADTTVSISASVDLANYTIAWLDFAGDTISETLDINVGTSGPFITSVTGLNACTARDTITAQYDTLAPIATIILEGEIRCQFREAILDGSASSPQPLSYMWTSTDGTILSNPNLSSIDILDTGLYVLEITQLDNGCTATNSLQVDEHPDAITSADLIINSAECHGQGNASIFVDALNGGVGLINYQLNGSPQQTNPLFEDLTAGQYLLSIIDEANCVFDTLVQIDTTIVFTVDAGPDIEIYLGEDAELSGMTDLPSVFFSMDEWKDVNGTICTDCPEVPVSPLETTAYTFQVTSSTGCVLADEMMVYVIEKAKFFIPNIFSPNGDGTNDEVRIGSSGGIERVVKWIIYDRWGNAVFGKTDFDPMDTSVYWDGRTSTGDFPNPGVFPYVVEFQLINGKTKVYHGEITLLR